MQLLNEIGFKWHISRKGRKIKLKSIPVVARGETLNGVTEMEHDEEGSTARTQGPESPTRVQTSGDRQDLHVAVPASAQAQRSALPQHQAGAADVAQSLAHLHPHPPNPEASALLALISQGVNLNSLFNSLNAPSSTFGGGISGFGGGGSGVANLQLNQLLARQPLPPPPAPPTTTASMMLTDIRNLLSSVQGQINSNNSYRAFAPPSTAAGMMPQHQRSAPTTLQQQQLSLLLASQLLYGNNYGTAASSISSGSSSSNTTTAAQQAYVASLLGLVGAGAGGNNSSNRLATWNSGLGPPASFFATNPHGSLPPAPPPS